MGGESMIARCVRLRCLLEQRHWQNHRTFCLEYEKAATSIDPRLRGTAPSRAQLHRWLSGELQGLPYGDHCRVLETMFPEWSARQLFEVISVDHASGIRVVSHVEKEVAVDANRTAGNSPTASLLGSIPHNFSTEILAGFWVACYEYDTTCHVDISQLRPKSERTLTIKNFPPDPRVEGRTSSFRNEIEAELVNRHLIGYWKNINDAYYFGAIHLAVLPGEAVMEGYYTCFLNDVQVASARWKWVRIDPASLSGAELSQLVLREPRSVCTLVEDHSEHDTPLTLTAVTEVLK